MRKVLGIILLVVGAAAFSYGTYVSRQATQGQEKIAQAEENAQGTRRPLIGPVRKSMSAQASENREQKINQEELKVSGFEGTARLFQGIGALVFIVGVGSLVSGGCCKKHR